MADLTLAECNMFSKYYGDKKLVDNDDFWADCLLFYSDRNVPLPLADNAESRRKLHLMLKCPPGKCGICCHYQNTPVTQFDVQMISDNWQRDDLSKDEFIAKYIKKDGNGSDVIDSSQGCPFLVDNACSIYDYRPGICCEFPIQTSRESVLNNQQRVLQIVYRLKCPASLDVIRGIMREATSEGKMLLLPDLSLVSAKV